MRSQDVPFNPFPGLRPFEQHESHLFFGRDGQSDELLQRLRRTRFLAVVGTSGSGKSSLMRAGLLPALHGGFMAITSSRWHIALMRPSADPLGNLAETLSKLELFKGHAELANFQTSLLRASLSRSSLGLIETCKQAPLLVNENLLVVVDQFEELFRFKKEAQKTGHGDETSAFVQLLLEATRQQEVSIYVVLTMRSDFLGDCAQFRDFPEAINDGQYLIPRMTRDQRREAIAGPVAVGGAEITPRLVQRLLNDVGDNPDQLPILQHALMRTWDFWAACDQDAEPLDLLHYEAIGGMAKALLQHADEAYHELHDMRSKIIVEKLFKCLTERGPDNREIRRPTKLQEICAVAEADENEVFAVVESFRRQGRSFIMPSVNITLNSESIIDISHESLIRNWQRLKEWVDEEAQSAQIYRHLAETAVLHKQNKAGFWRDPDLQMNLNWRKEYKPNKAWALRYHSKFDLAMDFLERSKAKATTRLRTLAIIISFAFIVLLIALVAAISQKQLAERRKIEAEKHAQHAAEHAQRAAAEARHVAEEADRAKRNERRAIAAEEDAERQAGNAKESAQQAQEAAKEARDQEALAKANEAKALTEKAKADRLRASTIAIELVSRVQRQLQFGNTRVAALLARQAFLFDESSGRQFQNEVYNAMRISLNQLPPLSHLGGPITLLGHSDWIRAVALRPKKEQIVSGSSDGTLLLWKLQAPEARPKVLAKSRKSIRAVAFSPNGNFLAVCRDYSSADHNDDHTIELWSKLDEPHPDISILGQHRSGAWTVAFSPDGDFFATGGADSTVRIWNVHEKKAVPGGILNHSSRIKALAFSRDGNKLVSGTEDGSLWFWIWRGENSWSFYTINNASSIHAIAFSPGGDTLATGDANKNIKLWRWKLQKDEPDALLLGHGGPINSLAFSPDGKMLASGSSDQTVRLWNLEGLAHSSPIVLEGHESWVWSVVFSSNGSQLISSSADRTIRIWFTNPKYLANLICETIGVALEQEEWKGLIGSGVEYISSPCR